MPPFLAASNLQRKMTNMLIEPFNSMTTFFFRRSVEKAFQLDEPPTGLSLNPNKPLGANPPFITSAVDDVMYIVNQIIQRSLATSQRSVIAGVVPTIGRVLGSDFVGMVQRKMRDESYPKAAIQGALPPEDKVIAFLVLINNLEVATDYIKRIVMSHVGTPTPASTDGATGPSVSLGDLFPFNHDATFVLNQLKAMEHGFEAKATELVNEAVAVTFHQVIKPRVRPILAEAFRDVEYDLSADALAPAEPRDGADAGAPDAEPHEDAVRNRFDRGWGAIVRPIKRILAAPAFDKLLGTALAYLARALEKRVWSHYGRVSELGAVRLERDVAAVAAAAVAGGRYGLRDAFARCAQMTLVMNMEQDEWEALAAAPERPEREDQAGVVWQLDASERERARAIVKDRAG